MTPLSSELARLHFLTVKQLKLRYAEVFGEQTNGNHKTWLIRRIAWRLQALAEGDLSERARKRAEELACDADLRLNPPRVRSAAPRAQAAVTVTKTTTIQTDTRLPPPGSVLRRTYKGQTVEVLILPAGFECKGTVYNSLSSVAKAICGSHVNGFAFFQLNKERA